jgi:hypothetical protein
MRTRAQVGGRVHRHTRQVLNIDALANKYTHLLHSVMMLRSFGGATLDVYYILLLSCMTVIQLPATHGPLLVTPA